MVVKFLVVYQIPLAACVFVTPSVAFAWEVNPFGMPKLVTHEVEIAPINSGSSNKPYHLMQGNATVGNVVLVSFLEMPIHVGINKAENDGFIAYQSLVVTFAIRDGQFVRAAVLHFPEDGTGFPILV